ncbi:shufflon system plasmid conjugative transfer pilus tip adhesin PilV [Pectobacterium punjabense]|uniref:Shufflon system plasmid conjugative transfer pilus tip adhesin PilV n=1 Tax=Pectobacterium punjabense TaxID=2108399 RepID=A0ABX6L0L6_9GAMM|nr:shufflon system plasmid conjugative transfer pilus tip adhesin PilV [Pectobacterium punjabense]MBS4433283.1 shufflon system plasmid conjugative transfer pilus tip adhesin PilV [Pectobacterium punjabense]PTA64106.1 shufflon system plasmid conjugative transfer pilus tip adhesin PilV [Pectobacterium punjabense]QJA19872.1 shufflon system plasmid conjugative transfer pilus tip adhesin PilV [Pectobacterium punjabense]
MIKHKKGFSLLEITLVLGVGVVMAFMKFQDMKSNQENIMANTVGSQMKQMGEAVNRYISIRYDKLSTLSSSSSQSSDPGPRICSATGCEITHQTLVNEGLLPVSYTGINAQKSSYKIMLKRAGTTPNYVINGLVITTLPWLEGNRVRYDLLGRAMQASGIDSGMTQSATVASGTGGQWTENQNSYSGINAAGLLAYRVGYDSAMYSVYLRRDGTLPMTGDLNMGGQSIDNVKDITASGAIKSQRLSSSGIVEGTHLNATEIVQSKNGTFSNNLKVQNQLTVDGYSTFNNIVKVNQWLESEQGVRSRGALIVGKENERRLWLGCGTFSSCSSDNAIPLRIEDESGKNNFISITGTTSSPSSMKLDVVGSQRIRGDLTLLPSSDGLAKGDIVASGNIVSSGTVSGQYLQVKSTSVAGASCSPDGLISKDDKGATLSCQSGIWGTNSGGLITVDGGTCPAGVEPVLYYASIAVFWNGQVRTNPYGDEKLWVPQYNINEMGSHCTTHGGGEKGEKESCRPIPKYINITKVKCG